MGNGLGRIRTDGTLRKQSLDILSSAILSGKLKPGDRLNESELARKLHISRAPVREALQQLQEQGLIMNVPRRGMFVVDLDDKNEQMINSLRIVLEAEALRLARMYASAKEKEKLVQLLKSMEGKNPGPSVDMVRVDMKFHRMIWSFSRNRYLEKVLTSLTAPLFANGILKYIHEEKQRTELDSHRQLVAYILGRCSKPAEQVMLEHLALRHADPARFSSFKDKLVPSFQKHESEHSA